ncbi:hypothetical protein [Anabaena sp. UHCC 0399]|uniref:hypothetical protein n=1 Tax=Anabaena sp. UHCC 0399 TaxID=3110238 RepID=UPI002B1F07D5|nr:hypothetical protein [Anabaena sp. UHCC 0399]MEA5567649.1 hypothetical protein [Anabaena sp. UHCC 0399]
MNTKLVESILQLILSLPTDERLWLEEKLFSNIPYPSSNKLMNLAESGHSFNFLYDEPDIYTLEDGERI